MSSSIPVSSVFFCLVVVSLFLMPPGLLAAADKDQDREVTYRQLEIFANVLGMIQDNYVDAVDTKKVVDGAIHGLLYSLDPHSSYLEPDEFTELQEETEGAFTGIGIEVSVENNQLIIISPIEGTPADRAGLMAKDVIVAIGKEKTDAMGADEAIKRLRGPKGSKITISISRSGWEEPKEFTLRRDTIPLHSVKAFFLAPGVIYARITNFQENTTDELKKAVADLGHGQKISGMILDMRNNPGGLLNQAVSVSDVFLTAGAIVYTRGRTEEQNMQFSAHNSGDEPRYPLVILVNEGTASAAEIVAGALQAHKRGILVGTRTFGKGSVQTIIQLPEGAALRLTTARYFTPDNRSIQALGISPDVEVALASPEGDHQDADKEKSEKEKQVREADLPQHLPGMAAPPAPSPRLSDESRKSLEKDNQLQTALNILKSLQLYSQSSQLRKD
ncbi:MAG: S41 family peptidase [Desulfobulbaceae bacterium]|nr:S41 family peptidase [Desulfobulbaceae bacterium]